LRIDRIDSLKRRTETRAAFQIADRPERQGFDLHVGIVKGGFPLIEQRKKRAKSFFAFRLEVGADWDYTENNREN
jgi:hypothetical protein